MILRHTAKGDTLTPSSGDEEPAPRRPASVGPRRERTRERVVRGLESIPLTYRLVVILLVLLMAALTLSSFATSYLMRRDLLASTDQQLRSVKDPVARQLIYYSDDDRTLPNAYAFAYMPVDEDRRQAINPTAEQSQPALPYLAPDDSRVVTGRPFTVPSTDGTTEWRFIAGTVDTQGTTYAVGIPLRGQQHTVARLLSLTFVIGVVVSIISGVLGWFATQRALRPLRKIEDVAAAIAAGDLSRRVPVRTSHDEVASLSDSLNVMLGRIEGSFSAQEASETRMRQFVADASHELRTPLATVRGYAELYRQGAIADEVALDTSMQRIEGEASRMSVLVDDLLTLARLDDERPLEHTEVDLLVLCAEAAHDARARDPERPIHLVGLTGELSPVVVRGDDAGLRQVVGNLLSNALMHAGSGVPIEVAVGTADGRAVVEVRDHGVGMDDETAARVFERFFRADKARSRAKGGSGLGLAIVAALVEQHHGEVSVGPTPGGGATFRVTLPLAA